jgi:hypothetical protein
MSLPVLQLPREFTESDDGRAVDAAIRNWTASVATEKELLSALACLPNWRAKFTDSFSLEHHDQTITWFRFESLIWALGEAFRQILKRRKTLRRHPTVFEQIEAVCRDSRFGKGRESFTMVLGRYGGPATVPTLLHLLSDQQVCGHAVYALRLLGACDTAEHVRPFLDHDKTWIRQEARKFFAKCEGHA